jgi:hypothetical protein
MAGAVFACRPVDLTELQEMMGPGFDANDFKVYANSEQRSCEECGNAIWVGPRIAMAKEIDPDAPLVCLLCAVQNVKSSGIDKAFHLGNTTYEGEST